MNNIRIFYAEDEKTNRKILEQKKADILAGPEKNQRQDGLKQLELGISPYVARCAGKIGAAIGLDLASLRTCTERERAKRLARIHQIIELCRKEKTPLAHNTESSEGRALLLSLGASTAQAAHARAQSF